ncbi:MAG: UDP-N-acetylmuramoyl-L-alanine--D-glutamate ligase [Ruminococcaceae bacterium]|nr:UDP-N-acetylmuramoyl-L-alanine--D-glutamate ligase [Oscillospiraceae bacterium]
MNQKLEAWKNSLKQKKICVVGIGISHLPLIDYLVACGAEVTACDKKTEVELGETAQDLLKKGVHLHLGEGYLSNLDGEVIFKTPGLRPDVLELLQARKRGAHVTTEMDVFMELCPAPVVAVTGSDGKTTTTTLIYKLLSMAGFTTHVGGNIGAPLLPVIDSIQAQDRVVLELSSFQLQTMKHSPQTAVVTNITPNHLDYHKDYQEYIDAKKNLFLYQNVCDTVVLNMDNDVTASFAKESRSLVRGFSRQKKADVYLKDGKTIMVGDEAVLDIDEIKVPGMHNVENYMAAIAAVYPLVSKEVIRTCAREFGGVAHRIEFVRELGGVRYYNSSIDSSPNRTINTLNVFAEPVVLIAGGKDKGIRYDDLGPAIKKHVKALVLIGATSKTIGEVAAKDAPDVPAYYEETYEAAVRRARSLATAGDVVLLSNASTSFDMFPNFEVRGNLFKELVNQL